jgi:Putative Ig domain
MSLMRIRTVRSGVLTLVAALASCGGGNSGPAAPSGLSYPAPPPFTVKQAITALTPTVTGSVTGYTVTPALPSGLSLSAATGVISGTPTAVTAKTSYTVSASNAGGATSTAISIVVNDAVPGIAYESPAFSFSLGVPAPSIAPTTSGGKIVSWSIAPALPTGLTFDTSDGSISGTPAVTSAPAPYVVSATNSGGTSTVTLGLGVGGLVVDLGHGSKVQRIRFSNNIVLSQGGDGRWILWSYSPAAMVASGYSAVDANSSLPFPVDLAGPTAVMQTSSGLEVRAAANGSVESEIAAKLSWWKLATDGSYVCGGNGSGLTVWSPAGDVIFSQLGDYSAAVVFAAPGQILAALGPAGANVVQALSVPSGAATLSPAFMGQFQSWFVDGSRFLTATGTTVWVYSNQAVQLGLQQLTTTAGLTGLGNWFWTFDDNGNLAVYSVGANAPAELTYAAGISTAAIASGSSIGILSYGQGAMSVVDLSGASPVKTDYSVPIAYLSAYAQASLAVPANATWLVGNGNGVLLDGSSLAGEPRYLDYGQAWSIAGSSTNFMIATASGRILNYLTDGTQFPTISFSSSSLALSADASTLAAASETLDSQFAPAASLNIYELPNGELSNSYPFSYLTLQSMTMSASGTLLGEVFWPSSNPACGAQTIPLTGGAPLWCDTSGNVRWLQLSPDGTEIAATLVIGSNVSTNIYKNGTLVTAVAGWAAGWLDNNRLMADIFAYPTDAAGPVFTGAALYDASGNVLNSFPGFPGAAAVYPATSAAVYVPSVNAIYSATTGALTWRSANPAAGALSVNIGVPTSVNLLTGVGAVSGSEIVFTSGNLVLVQPFQ